MHLLETGLLSSDAPWWILFFALTIGHFLGDYPLQGDFLAIWKNHRLPDDFDGPGSRMGPQQRWLWFHCLTGHSAIHGGIVWLVTGIPFLGLVEFVVHWLIDFGKSEGWTNFHVDQLLHLICKAAYASILVWAILPEGVLNLGR